MKSHRFGFYLIALIGVLLLGHAASPPEAATSAFKFDDFLIVPLRFHLLSAKDAPKLATTLTEKDMTRILGKMNGVWAQAGVHFYRESLVREEADKQELYGEPSKQGTLEWVLELRPAATQGERLFNLYYLKQMGPNGVHFTEAIFVKDTASLHEVAGGIDEPLPRVSSHELGHAFSLPHRQDKTNLMASGTTGTAFNAEEIARARAAARKIDWIETATVVLQQADALYRAKQTKEARALYERLATLPLKAEPVERAKKRAAP